VLSKCLDLKAVEVEEGSALRDFEDSSISGRFCRAVEIARSRVAHASLNEIHNSRAKQPMTSNSSSHDIIHNKINVLLAQNQRFVASWPSLQQKCKQQTPNVKSEAQVEKEEQEIFTPMPDLYV